MSYAVSGDIPPGYEAPAPQTGKHVGDAVTLADPPSSGGYTFEGWYLGDETVTGFDMPAGDVTVTGRWTVDVYADGPAGEDPASPSRAYAAAGALAVIALLLILVHYMRSRSAGSV